MSVGALDITIVLEFSIVFVVDIRAKIIGGGNLRFGFFVAIFSAFTFDFFKESHAMASPWI